MRRAHLNLLLVFLLVAFAGVFLEFFNTIKQEPSALLRTDLVIEAKDFNELSAYFTDLARTQGAVYAFEVLKNTQLPPNTDLHLLGHVVGDELYKQEGVEGMGLCTHDFRNACSHAIVIGALLEYGEGVIPLVQDACKGAPGGSGAYTMCFHGFGHGVLAYNRYDFPDTVELCRETGTEAYGDQEFSQCVSGAVMEILGGGGHDRELWLEKREEYLPDDDPLYLCSSDIIPEEAKQQCYAYLTPHLFEFGGGDLGHPTEEDYKAAFSYCEEIPQEEERNRAACFGGVGKELVVLAQDRDIRKIEDMTDEQMNQVYNWCLLAPHNEAINACIAQAVQSLYWGGENDRSAALRFCGETQGVHKDACFTELIGAVGYYIADRAYKDAFCTELPDEYKGQCSNTLK